MLYFQLPCAVCISCRAESQVEENCRYHTTCRSRLKLSGRMTVKLGQVRFEQQSAKQKAFGYSAKAPKVSFSSNYNKFSVRHLRNNQSIFSNKVWLEICKPIWLKVRLFLFRIYSIECTLVQCKQGEYTLLLMVGFHSILLLCFFPCTFLLILAFGYTQILEQILQEDALMQKRGYILYFQSVK